MTIQAILHRASALLDQAEPAFEQEERHARLLDALESGLCELSRVFPLQARCRVGVQGGFAPLPPQVLVPRALLKGGKRIPFFVEEGQLAAEDGEYTLIYYRTPPQVGETDPLQDLPYPTDLLNALPFYCAALCVMGDDPNLYNRLMEQYNTKIGAALGYRPVANVEGGGAI